MKVPVYKRQVDMTMETGSRDLTASLNPNAMAAPAIALAGVGKQIMSIAGQKFQHDQAEKKVKNENDVNNALLTGIEQTKKYELQAIEEVKSDPVKAEENFRTNLQKILPPLLLKIKDKNAQDKLRFKLGKFLLDTQFGFEGKNVQIKTDFVVNRNEQLNKSFTTGIMNKNLDYDIRYNSLKEVVDNYKKLTADGFQTPAEEQQKINAFKQNTMLEMSVELSRSYKNPQLMLTQLLNQQGRDDVVFETEDGEQDEFLNEMIDSLDPGEERSLFLSALNKKLKDIINIRDDENKRQKEELENNREILVDTIYDTSKSKVEKRNALRTLEEGYRGFEDTDLKDSEFNILYDYLGIGENGDVSFAEADNPEVILDLEELNILNSLTPRIVFNKKGSLTESTYNKYIASSRTSSDDADVEALLLARVTIGYQPKDNEAPIDVAQRNLYNNIQKQYLEWKKGWSQNNVAVDLPQNPNKIPTIPKEKKDEVVQILLEKEQNKLNNIFVKQSVAEAKLAFTLNIRDESIKNYIKNNYDPITNDNVFTVSNQIIKDFQNFTNIPALENIAKGLDPAIFGSATRVMYGLQITLDTYQDKIK
jgi:hypothetical protein